MHIEYIIVQAGGKGTRLGYLTRNKPKALVPVENIPMIFHLFRMFPDRKFIIIGDYKKDVFRKYLSCFADVKYLFVEADGTGTCGGLSQAMKYIPEKSSFMYIWSDLILADDFKFPEERGNYIGISCDFECRWSYTDDTYREERSCADGIAGLFIFETKETIADIPDSGEFVRYLQSREMLFKRLELHGAREFGVLSEYEKLQTEKCRPFNFMSIDGEILTKEGIDRQGKELAVRETAWYKKAKELGYERIPKIHQYEPLKMQLIHGRNIYEMNQIGLPDEDKYNILVKLIGTLQQLHQLDSARCDYFSIQEAYINKTFARLDKIRNLVPYANQEYIVINGTRCRNAFFCRKEIEQRIMSYDYDKFKFIHGDCTFSNIMLDQADNPILLDPRGYFGHTELYGDEDYDWAKLYYSLKGNYDQFNLKRFRLQIENGEVNLQIQSNGFENIADELFAILPELNKEKVKLLHAVIWLSLTTYAWQDYDSVCGAFYSGCYYLEETSK